MTPEQVRMLADKYFDNPAESDAFVRGFEYAVNNEYTSSSKTIENYNSLVTSLATIAIAYAVMIITLLIIN
jgi:hypothetical protein